MGLAFLKLRLEEDKKQQFRSESKPLFKEWFIEKLIFSVPPGSCYPVIISHSGSSISQRFWIYTTFTYMKGLSTQNLT